MEQDNSKVTGFLLMSTTMAVTGSTFQFGYNTGVINAPEKIIKQFYNQTWFGRYNTYMKEGDLNLLWGFTVAVFAAGGMIGSLGTGGIVKKLGLIKCFWYNNILAAIAALLMGLSKVGNSFEMIVIGRFVIGVNSGANMVIAPMYLTEIAPVKYRGIFGTLGQLGVVSTILISEVFGLKELLGTERGWPLLLGLTGAFVIIQIALLPFCSESPRYLLVEKNDPEKAKTVLMKLRGKDYDPTVELEGMKKEYEDEKNLKKTNIVELFKRSSLRKPLLIAVVLQLSQQFSGITAVFYYSTGLFIDAGIPEEYTGLTTVGMGVVNVIMTLVSLSLIERAGRRMLHLVGLGGMCVCAIFLVVVLNLEQTTVTSYLSIAPVLIFVGFFQIGPGSIPWFITSELFTQSARPAAVSIAGLTNWFGNFTIALIYPLIEAEIHGYTFIIFAALLAIFFAFTYFLVPETKGKDINEITALFTKKKVTYDGEDDGGVDNVAYVTKI